MNNIIERKWKRNSMVNIEDLRGMAFQGEKKAHIFNITGIDASGNKIMLAGTPSGVVLRPDHTDVVLDCEIQDGIVRATLPKACYDVQGRIGISIFLTDSGQTTCLYAAIASVNRTSSGTVSPGAATNVLDLVNAISAAVNTIPQSWSGLMADIAPTYSSSAVYAVGAYVYYNGDLYRCKTAITSGETWNSAHWQTAAIGTDLLAVKNQMPVIDDTAGAGATTKVWSASKTTGELSELKNEIGVTPIYFTEDSYIALENPGTTVTVTPVSSNISKYIMTPCKAGDVFTVYATPLSGSGTVAKMRSAAFLDSSYKCLVRSNQTETFSRMEFVAPANGYFVINAKKSETGIVYKNGYDGFSQIRDNTKNLDSIYRAIAKNNVLNATGTETGKVYSATNPYGSDLNNYVTRSYSVSGGDCLLLTVQSMPSGAYYRLAMFYDASDNFVGYANKDGDDVEQTNVFVRVPDSAVKMRISSVSTATVEVKKLVFSESGGVSAKTVKLLNNVITIECDNYIMSMSKHGNNNLFDFLSIANKQGDNIYTASSDWQGPYNVAVVNNANGDAIAAGAAFTGGNHAYEGTGSSGTPTARTTEIHVFADGTELSDGDEVEWSDSVDVKWTNYVQAWNTKKADGTGREVLKETPWWHFTADGTVTTQNNIEALEAIDISLYYGMQMQASWMDGGVFIPSATRGYTSMSVFTSEGLGVKFSGYETVGIDTDVIIKMGFNPLVDLGTGSGINTTTPAGQENAEKRIHTSTSKLYFYMMYNLSLLANEHALYNGYYKFIKP